MSDSEIDTYSVDHHYNAAERSNKTVILYGQMGTPDFLEYHRKLKFLAEQKEIDYILRHYIKDRSDRKLRLSGYGVELQMKSTEYKATDDSDIKDNSGNEAESASDGLEEIEGINFGVLKYEFLVYCLNKK